MFESNQVFAIRVFAHRAGWDGSVCGQPQDWDCGASPDFRHDYCATGDTRCFHRRLYHPQSPAVVLNSNPGDELFEAEPDALDDQVVVFFSQRFEEPGGVERNARSFIHGAYWVKGVNRVAQGSRHQWEIVPHEGAWFRLPMNQVAWAPQPERLNPFLFSIRGSTLRSLIDAARVDDILQRARQGFRPDELRRLQTGLGEGEGVGGELAMWLDAATERARMRGPVQARVWSSPAREERPGALAAAFQRVRVEELRVVRVEEAQGLDPADPERSAGVLLQESTTPGLTAAGLPGAELTAPGLAGVDETPPAVETTLADDASPVDDAAPADRPADAATSAHQSADSPAATSAVAALPSVLPGDLPRRTLLPEPGVADALAATYGPELLGRLRLAFATKDIVVLTGPPGTGKSRLAVQLLDDPLGARRLIVPVASTWRGREDLLGYVHPVSGAFEPTAFTEFLLAAAAAWDAGDLAPRLVLFEEFNLSQPEHWLSDLLVRMEYPPEARADRTLELGGSSVRGHPGTTGLYLSPGVLLVATVNNDHTVRELSPRVLDRAALVAVELSPREALRRLGIVLGEDALLATEQLTALLRNRGITFSIRTAQSVARALRHADVLGLDAQSALDRILVQEVLSKLRLHADDPADVAVMVQLRDWAATPVAHPLVGTVAAIQRWSDDLMSGLDLVQA